MIETLVANHRAFLGFLERRLGNRAEAEDILQDAFVRGIERAETIENEESSVAWFYRMLRNAVIDHHRRKGSSERALAELARELDASIPASETRDVVCACVLDLSSTLKPEYAEALRRVEIEGQTVKAWAAEAGIEPNNAAVRLHRARAALKKSVVQSCGTCAEHGCLDCTCQH
jgi:RNA polymerase sigma-70 factor (ECF subfamily)